MNNSFEAWQNSINLDPELSTALARMAEAGKSASASMGNMANAFAPFQAMFEISEKSTQFFSGLDWGATYKNLFQPNAYAQSLEAFTQLQQNVFKKMIDGQTELMSKMGDKGKQYMEAPEGIASPQKALASYINKSLDAFEEAKKDAAEQSASLAEINGAYMAWMQNTVQNFSKAK